MGRWQQCGQAASSGGKCGWDGQNSTVTGQRCDSKNEQQQKLTISLKVATPNIQISTPTISLQ